MVAGEREDVQAYPVAYATSGAQICAEGRLAVCPRRYEFEPSARVEDASTEIGHDPSTLVLERHWRHCHKDLFGEKVHQCFEIGGFPCACELRDNRLLDGRVRARR